MENRDEIFRLNAFVIDALKFLRTPTSSSRRVMCTIDCTAIFNESLDFLSESKNCEQHNLNQNQIVFSKPLGYQQVKDGG